MQSSSYRHAVGLAAEAHAARLLEAEGLRVVARRYRCPAGEIDLIARHGRALVFVEVRARRSTAFGHPAETVSAAKQRRIVASARHYLRACGRSAASLRFDVVSVVLGAGQARVEWIRGAFVA